MKKTIRILGATTSFILILSLTGCYYDEVYEDLVPPPNENVSYAMNIQPIFNQYCVSCHDGGLDPDLRTETSYTFITVTDPDMVIPNQADESELYQRLIGVGNIMPPSGALSNIDINLVKDWINQGALNN